MNCPVQPCRRGCHSIVPDGAVEAVRLDHMDSAADEDRGGRRCHEAARETAGGQVLPAQAAPFVHSGENEHAVMRGLTPPGVRDHRQAAAVEREPRPAEGHAGREGGGELDPAMRLHKDQAPRVRPEEDRDRPRLPGGERNESRTERDRPRAARLPAAVGPARGDPQRGVAHVGDERPSAGSDRQLAVLHVRRDQLSRGAAREGECGDEHETGTLHQPEPTQTALRRTRPRHIRRPAPRARARARCRPATDARGRP